MDCGEKGQNWLYKKYRVSMARAVERKTGSLPSSVVEGLSFAEVHSTKRLSPAGKGNRGFKHRLLSTAKLDASDAFSIAGPDHEASLH